MRIIKIFLYRFTKQKELYPKFIKILEELKEPEDIIEICNMDTTEGYMEALNKNIFYYLPCICVYKDDIEIGSFEYLDESEEIIKIKLKEIL